jgi:hypothetical protein
MKRMMMAAVALLWAKRHGVWRVIDTEVAKPRAS